MGSDLNHLSTGGPGSALPFPSRVQNTGNAEITLLPTNPSDHLTARAPLCVDFMALRVTSDFHEVRLRQSRLLNHERLRPSLSEGYWTHTSVQTSRRTTSWGPTSGPPARVCRPLLFLCAPRASCWEPESPTGGTHPTPP